MLCTEYVDPDQVKELAKRFMSPSRAYYFVRDEIEYVDEPRDTWRKPADTLEEMRGDCDDKAILLASLLIAMGFDAWVRIGTIRIPESARNRGVKPGTYDHAWVIVRQGLEWIELDPSCSNCRYGTKPFETIELIMDFNNKMIVVHNAEKARSYVLK